MKKTNKKRQQQQQQKNAAKILTIRSHWNLLNLLTLCFKRDINTIALYKLLIEPLDTRVLEHL